MFELHVYVHHDGLGCAPERLSASTLAQIKELFSMDLATIKAKLDAAAAAQANETNVANKAIIALDGLKAASDAQKAQIAVLIAQGTDDPAALQALADGADAISAAAGATATALQTTTAADEIPS